MKIIAISGRKYSQKDLLATMLAKNSDCVWIQPYTDGKVPIWREEWESDGYIHLNPKQLSEKMKREVPLAVTEVKGTRYVFFENQLNQEYVVLIADDTIIKQLKDKWKSNLVTIKCKSKGEELSNRCRLGDSEFDYVFNVDTDDYDFLEAMII